MRLILISGAIYPNFQQFIGIFSAVLLQCEEILFFFFKKNVDEEEEDEDGGGFFIPKNIIYKSEWINIPMIPSILFLLAYSFNLRSEFTFILVFPCLLLLYFYINSIWLQMVNFTSLNYSQMGISYLSFFAYLGMIFICFSTKYFAIGFFSINSILTIMMKERYVLPFTKKSKKIFINILVYIPISIIVLFSCGIELRNLQLFQQYSERVSHKTLNYLLLQKFIQNNYLLALSFLDFFGKISNPQPIKNEKLLILVILFAVIYSIINILEIYKYIIYPFYRRQMYVEIESYEELVTYNQSNRIQTIDTSRFQQIAFKNLQKLNAKFIQKEYVYCLFFNFQEMELEIPGIGSRIRNRKGFIVSLQRLIDPDYLQQQISQNDIISNIYEIELKFTPKENEIIQLIKVISEGFQRIIVVGPFINNELIHLQKKYLKKQKSVILIYIIYQKYIESTITLNPYAVYCDLYENEIDTFIF